MQFYMPGDQATSQYPIAPSCI